MKVKLPEKLECRHCHHKWMPRVEEVVICPGCGTPYWFRDKVSRQKKEK